MKRTHDIIVIGAGAAGLTAAGGAAQLGLSVALIERDKMGGECLNSGCVPSKALIAAAKRAQAVRSAPAFGILAVSPEIDFARVSQYVHGAIEDIAPHDSEERFRGFGVEVIRGNARFTGPRVIEVNGRRLNARRYVVAVGSRPAVPPIDGLHGLPFLTNENLFQLKERPRHLLVLGGGAIGMEMAQAFRRLGSDVTVIEAERPLAREDSDAAALALASLKEEGVTIHAGSPAVSAAQVGGDFVVVTKDGVEHRGTHLLVATGRAPSLDDLGLDAADVTFSRQGICVDARRRTSNRRIYAIGDCRDGPRFTHIASHEGELTIRNICFGLPARMDGRQIPRVTFTDPEIAQLGLTEAEAREKYGNVRVVRELLSQNDRAVTERSTKGFLKIIMTGRKLAGVTIVGHGAGELLLPWTLAMQGTASTWKLAGAVVAYPTYSELSRAGSFLAYRGLVFGPLARTWVNLRKRFLL